MLAGLSVDCAVRVTIREFGSIERKATKAVTIFCVEAGMRVVAALLAHTTEPVPPSTT